MKKVRSLFIIISLTVVSLIGAYGVYIGSVSRTKILGITSDPAFRVNFFPQKNNLDVSIRDAYAEIPTAIIPGGARGYFLSTNHSYYCWSPNDLFSPNLKFSSDNCVLVIKPNIYGVSQLSNDLNPWKRNYSGEFSSLIAGKGMQANILALTHNENKNEFMNGQYIQGTINKDILASTCSSRYDSKGVYTDCWPAYNGFVGLAYTPYTAANKWGLVPFNDLGPIIWPSNGYLTEDGKKSSYGVRHPKAIIKDGYVYAFYLDSNAESQWEEGRYGCIKTARASLNENGLPESFMTYYRNGFTQKSLPDGFDIKRISTFYKIKGGKSSCIFGDMNPQSISFAVAKIRSTNYYLGVEEAIITSAGSSMWVIQTRLSQDLVNWSKPVVIGSASSWNQAPLHYPIFLDKTKWNNQEIDADDFYILGSDGTSRANIFMHLSVNI